MSSQKTLPSMKPVYIHEQNSLRDTAGAELREGRLSERLAVLLAAEIVSGRMPTGDLFASAEEIIEQYNVSRAVAREAIRALEMLGLVHVQHGKRSEVMAPSEWAILSPTVQQALSREQRIGDLISELYEVRLLLEPSAAAWMAERGTDEQVEQLHSIAATMEAFAAETRVAELLRADREFHNLIARGSGNRILIAVVRDLGDLVDNAWSLSASGAAAVWPDNAAIVAEQHLRIANSIGARDPDGTRQAMIAHIEWATQADKGTTR